MICPLSGVMIPAMHLSVTLLPQPEATLAVLEREIRAIPVAMWVEGLKSTPRAMLSRAVAGTRGNTLILNVPGSEKAARENLGAVVGTLEHAMCMIAAEGHG